MPKKSAGILVFRRGDTGLQLLLVHPGGPFWAKKDLGSWSIPKGEYAEDEEPLTAAQREFKEELGIDIEGHFIPLSPLRQKSGKMVSAWAIEADPGISQVKSNTFRLEWPPRSGTMKEFPEIDKAEWFDIAQAFEKINPAQQAFLTELQQKLK